MASDTYGNLLAENPVGLEISRAFVMTGIPYIWTDGKAEWSDAVYPTEKPGGLAENDLSFSMRQNPMEPLDVGSGVRVSLIDDDTSYLRQLFAPLYGDSSRLVSRVEAADTDISLADGSWVEEGDYLYLGHSETVKVTGFATETDEDNILDFSVVPNASYTGGAFDIEVTNGPITLTAIRYRIGTTLARTMQVYMRSGTAVGFTSSSVGWTQRATSVSAPGGSSGQIFSIPLDTPLVLANGVHGVYLFGNGSSVLYRAGVPISVNDTKAELTSYSVNAASFGTTFANYRGDWGIEYDYEAALPNQPTVDRAQLGTLAHIHNPGNSLTGPVVSSSPRVFRGRYGEIWAAPVDPVTGLLDAANKAVIWAGYVTSIRNNTLSYDVELDPLTARLRDFWPERMPAGTFAKFAENADTPFTINMYPDIYRVRIQYNGTSYTGPVISDLGTYDDTGTFNYVTQTVESVDVSTLLQWLKDTIRYNSSTDINAGEIQFMLDINRSTSGTLPIQYRNTSDTAVSIDPTFALGAVMNNAWGPLQPLQTGTSWGTFGGIVWNTSGMEISWLDKDIVIRVDDPANPFRLMAPNTEFFENYGDLVDFPPNGLGYARITNGDKTEVLSFYEVEALGGRLYRIKANARGIAGTTAHTWTLEDDKTARIEQVAMFDGAFIHVHAVSMSIQGNPVTDTLLHVLLSAGGAQTNSDYDLFHADQALAIPARYVHYEAFKGLSDSDILPLSYFWVKEAGKGSEEIEELMKAAGLTFTTRRFVRDGAALFGLSVDSIAQPVATTFTRTLTDSERTANSKVLVDYNERLLVNTVSVKPFHGSEYTGPPMYHIYAESSIADYGASKALKLEPSAIIGTTRAQGIGLNPADRAEVEFAEANLIAYKWFGAFSQGNYTITVVAGPASHRYQVGDRVLVTLSGVDSITGTDGLANVVGKVIEVQQGYYAGRIKIRLAYKDVYELAPCARVSAISGTTITFEDNEFSDPDGVTPYGQGGPVKDLFWFDMDEHNPNLPVTFAIAGTSTENARTISSTNLAAGTAVINASLDAAFTTAIASNQAVYMYYQDYTTVASGLAQLYAYIGIGSSWT